MMEEPTRKIGPYNLISKIGQGTFGVVWLGERRASLSTTQVALKLPRSEDIDLETFRSEAGIWMQASGHTNVLPLIEAEVYDGQVVIVSAYAPDGSLETWRTRHGGRAPSGETACEMMEGVLSGLAHLHRRRIIHRDLKPDNILLQAETPLLADFGISRVLRASSHFTKNISGTFAYMAPEAFDGKRDEQTDIWAAGVIFYELLAGRLPFDQQDTASLIGAIVRHDPPELLPGVVPEVLRRVVSKALRRDPAERYRTADEMRRDLREAGHQLWLERHDQSPRPPAPRLSNEVPPTRVAEMSPQRRTWSAGTISVALLASAVIVVGLAIAVSNGLKESGGNSASALNSNHLLVTAAANANTNTSAAQPDSDLVAMLNGTWVFAEWSNKKDARLIMQDGHGILSAESTFNVLQNVTAVIGQCPEGKGPGFILHGSNPRMKGSGFKLKNFHTDELCVKETDEGFAVWTRDYAHTMEWGVVDIRSQPSPVQAGGLAVLNGKWEFTYPGKTQVMMQMANGQGLLDNQTIYPSEREVDVASRVGDKVLLRVSSPMLAADRNTRAEDHPPGELEFRKQSDGTFKVYWRISADSGPWQQLNVKTSPNNN